MKLYLASKVCRISTNRTFDPSLRRKNCDNCYCTMKWLIETFKNRILRTVAYYKPHAVPVILSSVFFNHKHKYRLIKICYIFFICWWHWTQIGTSDIYTKSKKTDSMKNKQTSVAASAFDHVGIYSCVIVFGSTLNALKNFTSRARWANKMWSRALTMLLQVNSMISSWKINKKQLKWIGSLKNVNSYTIISLPAAQNWLMDSLLL